eukprot:GILK01007821.1.p1 GENE.GILK01007821.1~~GILK01007821.1.p1  ORF type:complete len:349 (+),score=61.25 GILK01007821.1:42-1049(+)
MEHEQLLVLASQLKELPSKLDHYVQSFFEDVRQEAFNHAVLEVREVEFRKKAIRETEAALENALVKILAMLPVSDIGRAACVSVRWNECSRHGSIWKMMFRRQTTQQAATTSSFTLAEHVSSHSKPSVDATSLDKDTDAQSVDSSAASPDVQVLKAELIEAKEVKEDALARLNALTNVKTFLVSKLKECERALSQALAEKEDALTQVKEEREALEYQRDKCRSLEEQVKTLKQQQKDTEREHQVLTDRHAQRIRVLEDLLTHANADKEDALTELNNQKKVLVKEIKSLRQQLTRSSTERDEFAGVLRAMKAAIAPASGSSGANSSPKASHRGSLP